jgi:hypothetical protein
LSDQTIISANPIHVARERPYRPPISPIHPPVHSARHAPHVWREDGEVRSRSMLDCLGTPWRERTRRGQAADGAADADMRVRPSIRGVGDEAAKLQDGRRTRSRRQDAETGDVGEKGRERSAVGRLFRLLPLLAALPTLLHSRASASASTACFELLEIAPSIPHATSHDARAGSRLPAPFATSFVTFSRLFLSLFILLVARSSLRR